MRQHVCKYICFELFLRLLLNTLPNECEKQMPAVYSSVYFHLTALINTFHRWCSPVIKGGQIQTALLEPSQHTDWISNCCQRLTEIQLTFFICEFASSQTEVTQHCSVITFERLHLRSGFTCSWSVMKQIGREFLIFVSSWFLSPPFISCSYSIFSTSTFLCLSSPLSCCLALTCLQYARVNMRLWGRDVLAVVFGSGFSLCRLPVLHIKQAVLRAQFISWQNLSVGWEVGQVSK